MVLTVSFVLSPVIGLVCHRRLRFLLADLTPASRRQNRSSTSAARVHRIPPRVRDDRASAPLWDETAAVVEVICPTGEAKYFCKWGWTENRPTGKSPTAAKRQAEPRQDSMQGNSQGVRARRA